MPKGVKAPRAQLMATYYAKLTQIFTRSENRLYNAYAWYRCVGKWVGGKMGGQVARRVGGTECTMPTRGTGVRRW